jgi:hypothetical protein
MNMNIIFFTNFTLWFYALPVHSEHTRKNYLEWNKIVKYNIHIYIYVKFENMLCMGVGWWSKKFGRLKLIFLLILCRELCKSTRLRTLCREPMGRLSAHLTAGPMTVTVVPLCREVPAVPRACFCSSRHSAFVPWAWSCSESLLCFLSAQMVSTVGSFYVESSCQNSRQSRPVPWARLLDLDTELCSRHRLRFR